MNASGSVPNVSRMSVLTIKVDCGFATAEHKSDWTIDKKLLNFSDHLYVSAHTHTHGSAVLTKKKNPNVKYEKVALATSVKCFGLKCIHFKNKAIIFDTFSSLRIAINLNYAEDNSEIVISISLNECVLVLFFFFIIIIIILRFGCYHIV